MYRFFLFIWLRWALFFTLIASSLALIFATLTTLGFYIYKKMPPLSEEVWIALLTIWRLWLELFFALGIVVALLSALRVIFYYCTSGFMLGILACGKEELSLLKQLALWRRWLFVMIWIVGLFGVMGAVFLKLFIDDSSFFEHFTLLNLYGALIIAGYFSFILMAAKCKKIELRRC